MPKTIEPDWQERAIQFVYELLSPGILGSMIYEMFRAEELERLPTFAENALWRDVKVLSQFVILCLFCMTWLYHRKSKGREGGMGPRKKGFILVIDFLSAIGFAVAFAFAGNGKNPCATPVSVLFIASAYCVAQWMRNMSGAEKSTVGTEETVSCFVQWVGVLLAGLAVLIMAADVVRHGCGSHNPWLDLIALWLVFLIYLYFLLTDRSHRKLGQPIKIDMSLAMATPDWLQARKGLLQPVARLDAVFVMLEGHPFFKLEVRPAVGKFACAVSQTNNGKRLDDPNATYPDIDTAFAGGLDQLRNALGW